MMHVHSPALHPNPSIDELLQAFVVSGLVQASPYANPDYAVPERMTIPEMKLVVFERYGRDSADEVKIPLN